MKSYETHAVNIGSVFQLELKTSGCGDEVRTSEVLLYQILLVVRV